LAFREPVPTASAAEKNAYLARGSRWRPSSEYQGSPGRDGLGPDNRVVVNEVLANSLPPQTDTIELLNTSGGPLDISGWLLSDSSLDDAKFAFPASTTIAPGGYLVLNESDFTAFALSSSEGDGVILVETDSGGNLLRFVDSVEFDASVEGETFGRWPDGTGRLYPMITPTFGASNASGGNTVRNGPVVVSEIHYNPPGSDDNLEFIQIRNSGAGAEDLTHWRLRGEADYDFLPGTALAPGGVLLLLGFDPANAALMNAFEAAYPAAVGMPRGGPWADGKKLDDSGGTIKLQRPDTLFTPVGGGASFYPMLVEDTVHYDDEGGWPLAADGAGFSLQRISDPAFSDEPGNWRAQNPPLESAAVLTYASWAESAFPPGTPEADQLPEADPDRDGLANIGEFALVLNPRVADAQQALVMTLDSQSGALFLDYRRRIGDASVSVVVAQSTDLQSWLPADVERISTTSPAPGVQALRVRFTETVPSETFRRLIFRIEVSGP
jgi:hypothetical protein